MSSTPNPAGPPVLGGLRLPAHLYLAGMFAIFLGERLVGGDGASRWGLDAAGLLLVLGSLGLMMRGMTSAAPDNRPTHRRLLGFGALGLAGLATYALGIEPVVDALGFSDEQTEDSYEAVISALWPIVWLAGALPMLAVDRVLAANPVAVVAGRSRDAAMAALGLSFALSMLFPLNYLAHETNERWDFGYFKTARPGTSTENMVGSLEEPIAAYLFFPTSSDVTEELRTYFDILDAKGGENFVVSYVDHALEPDLAKELRVRGNGNIALVRGEGDEQQVERIKIGDDFDSAKRKLKRLDEDMNKSLLKMARGKRIAYFTQGHGELHWDSGTDPLIKTSNLRKILRALNYSVKELTLADGLGTEIPEDATAVVVLGPESDMLPEEQAALDAYRKKGGSLLVALEPGGAAMPDVLGPLGVRYDPAVTLVHDSQYVPVTRRITDRQNLVTNKFSTHGSVTTLSRNSSQMVFIAPGAGLLEEAAGGGKTTATVKALDGTFGDRDGDHTFDADGEKRDAYKLAVAASGPIEDPSADWGDDRAEFRAIVMADATWASDPVLTLDANKANFQYIIDAISWLAHDEALQGTIESEEDVKIQHAKDEQGWIFYGTGFIIPLGFFGLGLGRISLRRRRGNA